MARFNLNGFLDNGRFEDFLARFGGGSSDHDHLNGTTGSNTLFGGAKEDTLAGMIEHLAVRMQGQDRRRQRGELGERPDRVGVRLRAEHVKRRGELGAGIVRLADQADDAPNHRLSPSGVAGAAGSFMEGLRSPRVRESVFHQAGKLRRL